MAELIDAYGRRLNYVRISVTDRCNFRCTYCMPPEGVKCLAHSDIMRYEEISLLCGALWDLGVRKFRFTGGEPLVRKDLVPFLTKLTEQLPGIKIALTTNGSLLGQYAESLAEIKLHSLNISLDTLNAEKFASITRLGSLDAVIEGIRAASKAGIRNIKLNAVLIRGFNDGEIGDLLRFSKEEGLLLRIIEFMPLEDGVWNKSSFISGREILQMLPEADHWLQENRHFTEDGPANYYRNEKSGDTIGIIAAVSNHFCPNCNRLRVSASGNLRLCLFSAAEISLRPFLVSGDTEGVKKIIIESIINKPRCWDDIRTGQLHMSGIGG
ncbi:MAG: GTP 3',8-cyclase MoaA [Synergistaceae bacterium]|nr:GTP 3',8-cyclase MoaA [Synergistaceae bacterium]